MNNPWAKLVVSALIIIAAMLVALIVNSLLPQTVAEQVGRVSMWPLLVVYLLFIWLAAKAHSISSRISKLEAERVVLKAQHMATSLWRVDNVSYETDMEDKRFVLFRLRHLSWNEWTSVAIRHWHPEFYEATTVRPGKVLEFEALTTPLNRSEKEDLCSYLRLRL